MTDNFGAQVEAASPAEPQTVIGLQGSASQWRLMWFQFRRHKMAMASLVDPAADHSGRGLLRVHRAFRARCLHAALHLRAAAAAAFLRSR